MQIAITNLKTIVTGDWRQPIANGDTTLVDGGTIAHVGTVEAQTVEGCDVVIDADGAVAIPGLIDSHVHITFGDYTPRASVVDLKFAIFLQQVPMRTSNPKPH